MQNRNKIFDDVVVVFQQKNKAVVVATYVQIVKHVICLQHTHKAMMELKFYVLLDTKWIILEISSTPISWPVPRNKPNAMKATVQQEDNQKVLRECIYPPGEFFTARAYPYDLVTIWRWLMHCGTHTVEDWTGCVHTHRHTKVKTVYPPVLLCSLDGYKDTITQNKLKPGLIAFYDHWPGNKEGSIVIALRVKNGHSDHHFSTSAICTLL